MTITDMTYEKWIVFVLRKELDAGLRVGQSYMNNVRPNESWPELYYETDNKKAHRMIWSRECQDSINLDEWFEF